MGHMGTPGSRHWPCGVGPHPSTPHLAAARSHKLKFHLLRPGRLRLRRERAAPVTPPAPTTRRAILLREQVPQPPPRPLGWPRLCHTTTGTAPAWLHHGCLERSRPVPKVQWCPSQRDPPAPHVVGCPHSILRTHTHTLRCLPMEGTPPGTAQSPPCIPTFRMKAGNHRPRAPGPGVPHPRGPRVPHPSSPGAPGKQGDGAPAATRGSPGCF